MRELGQYFSTLLPMVVIDALWIGLIAKGFYAKHMGFLFTKNVNITPVIFFYPIYAFVVLFLAVMPALSSKSWTEALLRGALLGLGAYGAYDLTNHATIAKWPLTMTLVDIAWGVFVTATTSIIAYFIITRAG